MKLKYRVWDKKANKYLDKTNWFCLYMDGEYGSDPVNAFQKGPDDNFVVQLWTGVRDRYGIEVYEGDVLKFRDESKYAIEWVSEIDGHDWTGWNIGYDRSISYGWVIGNIYENPELLK